MSAFETLSLACSLVQKMTTTARSFISYRRVSKNSRKQQSKPVESSTTDRLATDASNATLRKVAAHKSVGGQLISRALTSRGKPTVTSTPSEDTPTLRRKPALIGQSTEPSVAPSHVHVISTSSGTHSNPINTQGLHSLGSTPGNSPASFSQRMSSSRPTTRQDIPLSRGASYSIMPSSKPMNYSNVCLRPATTPPSASLPSTLGASHRHAKSSSVGSHSAGRRLVSSPCTPDQSREPSPYSGVAVNPIGDSHMSHNLYSTMRTPQYSGNRSRSHTASSRSSSIRVDTNSKALPMTPNRDGIDGYIPMSYSIYQSNSNPRVASVNKFFGSDIETSQMQPLLPEDSSFTEHEARQVAMEMQQSHGTLPSPTTTEGRSPRPGPAAGTVHEGYGKFAPKPCRRKSVLRRQRSVRAQGLARSGSVSGDLGASATNNTASPGDYHSVHPRVQDRQQASGSMGYCISPTPRLDLDPEVNVTSPPATSSGATDAVSAPKKKKRSKLNWTFIKHLCGAGSAKDPEEMYRPNEDAVDDANSHHSIIILPPPPPKDDPNAPRTFSLPDVGPRVPPKPYHLSQPSDVSSVHRPMEISRECCKRRTASNVTKPQSIASSAPSFPSVDTDMTEDELWSEYDEFLDDISNISESLNSTSPCRQMMVGHACPV